MPSVFSLFVLSVSPVPGGLRREGAVVFYPGRWGERGGGGRNYHLRLQKTSNLQQPRLYVTAYVVLRSGVCCKTKVFTRSPPRNPHPLPPIVWGMPPVPEKVCAPTPQTSTAGFSLLPERIAASPPATPLMRRQGDFLQSRSGARPWPPHRMGNSPKRRSRMWLPHLHQTDGSGQPEGVSPCGRIRGVFGPESAGAASHSVPMGLTGTQRALPWPGIARDSIYLLRGHFIR